MKASDKVWVLLSIFFSTLVLVWVLISVSHDPREQTVMLERIAAELNRVRTIPPETDRAIRELIKSVRQNESGVDEHLRGRRKIALERIDTILLVYTAAYQ